ncbi:MAG TPA: MoxR family ATPase [Herpetosiphonaceae bacterium]|nr:MoxR family ATPase [Herpetosiphonaceae bacterium]
MNPFELSQYLTTLVLNDLYLSTMIWGPPGIGKSSIVAQTAREHGLAFIDVRLSQLAPTDLRGLPVPEDGISRWFPPEFLPRDGRGILFLDELNMAPPAMQGVSQQLILDRRVGSYELPDGWFVWAAGNRKEDRASVFDMPAPLANRFVHLEVAPDFDSFKAYALQAGVAERVIAFLSFRTTLLHKLNPHHPAWPSPRSWVMASLLDRAGLDIAPVVGADAAAEFYAYSELYGSLPDLDLILRGEGAGLDFPADPGARYACTIGLTVRSATADAAYRAFRWMSAAAPAEWVQLLITDMMRQLRAKGQIGAFAGYVKDDAELQAFFQQYQRMLA